MSRTPSAARDHLCPTCDACPNAPCVSGELMRAMTRYHTPRRRLANLDPDPSGTPGWTRKKRR